MFGLAVRFQVFRFFAYTYHLKPCFFKVQLYVYSLSANQRKANPNAHLVSKSGLSFKETISFVVCYVQLLCGFYFVGCLLLSWSL